jgi:hypothetical protein
MDSDTWREVLDLGQQRGIQEQLHVGIVTEGGKLMQQLANILSARLLFPNLDSRDSATNRCMDNSNQLSRAPP